MARHARIEDGRVVEILLDAPDSSPLHQRYHPALLADVVAVPEAQNALVTDGWLYVDGVFVPSQPPAPHASPPPIRAIAPYSFRLRLPAATRRAITLAASEALERGDATLQTWLDDLHSTRAVLLDHPEIAAGLVMLRAAGLITEAEAAALLADGTAEEV